MCYSVLGAVWKSLLRTEGCFTTEVEWQAIYICNDNIFERPLKVVEVPVVVHVCGDDCSYALHNTQYEHSTVQAGRVMVNYGLIQQCQ